MSNGLSHKGTGAVLCFGELLLRICPDADGAWLAENKLPFYIGGAELNVATALALWNIPSKYFTALPQNNISEQIIDYVQQKGIDTSPVFYHGDRVGLYFLTKGRDMKHNALVYDRAHSAFAELKPGMVNWDEVLEGVSWLHFSAICPAVSENAAAVCLELLEATSAKNITISIDLNYRAKLWKYGKEPVEVMPKLVKYADLIMGNIWAADTMLGIKTDEQQLTDKESYLDASLTTSKKIIAQYPKCKAVANTFRFDGNGAIKYYANLYTGDQLYQSAEYTADKIIDKVGSGDCFMAGLIYGFYNGLTPDKTLAYATAAAFEKLFIESDATNKTVQEIERAIKYE